ncbi:MAG: biotin/lipoyl-binding protein [Chromatiaceae bacterium]
MKTTTRLVAFLTLLLFVWYLLADRMTPYTSKARLKAIVIEVVPQVSGYVAALAVTKAQLVEAGDLLPRIDQRPFVLEVEKARSALKSATQAVGASSSRVEIAQANLTRPRSVSRTPRSRASASSSPSEEHDCEGQG